MAGYSSTPLIRKVGIKPDHRVYFENAPDTLERDLGPLPRGVNIVGPRAADLDVGMLFVSAESELRRRFPRLKKRLRRDGMIWVCWPKKSSGVETDLAFDTVQHLGLDEGMVDVKICAVDEIWSGLKFVYRRKDR